MLGSEKIVFEYYRAITDDINDNNTKDIQAIVASSLWAAAGVSDAYIDSCNLHFKSEVHQLGTAQAINKWIEKTTKGMIKDIIKKQVTI